MAPLRRLARGIFVAAGLLLALLFGPAAVQALQTQYWPVLHDWQPTVAVHAGDVFVTGTMRKRGAPACDYIPPPRALDLDSGSHLQVVSLSKSAGQNWVGSDERRTFGPWMVAGGAGKRLQFFSEHECSGLWRSFSVLGVVDTRIKP